jgi:hypothetical protein
MNIRPIAQLTLLLLFCNAICLRADNPPANALAIPQDATVAEIVQILVERHGGARAVSRWRCGTITYVASPGLLPVELGPVRIKDSFDFPNGLLRSASTISHETPVEVTFVINEQGGWMTVKGHDPTAIDRSGVQREFHMFADYCNVSFLLDQVSNLRLVRRLEIEGKKTVQLHLESKELGSGDYFVDVETGLLTATSKVQVDPLTGAESIVAVRIGAYRDVDGIPVAMKFNSTSNGRPHLGAKIESVEFKESLPPGTFAKPDGL